jgi:hypothetical protein
VRQEAGRLTLSELWQEIVASGYFKSLPAVAFAGGLFKPINLDLVPGEVGPAQVSMKWSAEYYGGGATQLKFTPGVPMRGIEYTQFVGTSATSGDFLVSSPGNGRLYKVEANTVASADRRGKQRTEISRRNNHLPKQDEMLMMEYSEYYDLAFDSVTLGPLQQEQ